MREECFRCDLGVFSCENSTNTSVIGGLGMFVIVEHSIELRMGIRVVSEVFVVESSQHVSSIVVSSEVLGFF